MGVRGWGLTILFALLVALGVAAAFRVLSI